ncbi:MAG: sulfur carrier protein ThiS [Planctomycetota bacterium]|nr:sulfur carrier protein ThiS [Planctomycetota bacterium]
MKVTLNGDIKEIPAETTVADLLGQIGTTPERVAVELNLDVVPRGNYASTAIREGDSIEVVTFVGGG